MPRGVLLVERLLSGGESPLYARVDRRACASEIARTLRGPRPGDASVG